MDTLLQDIRGAFRTLRRNPGYTAVALLTLALGVGANTAVFSMVNAVLVRPLPFPDAGRLSVLWGTRAGSGQLLIALADIDDWRRESRAFEDIAVVRQLSVNLTGVDAPSRLSGTFVSANFFPVLGARAALGRLFTTADDVRGGGRVAVLSHAAWRTRFGADPAIIGRALTLNAQPYVVVGVAAADWADPWQISDVWVPIASAPDPWFQRGFQNVWAVGKLKPGATVEGGARDLNSIAAKLAATYPTTNAGIGARVIPLRESVAGQTGDTLLVLLAFVGLLLLIACVNVANLQVARAAARARELSLRAALGAGRVRLARQLLTESLVLAACGAAAGLFLAVWGTQLLVTMTPGGLPAFGAVGVDGTVLAYCAGLSLVTGVLFGTVPAIHATRGDVARALAERHAGGRSGRFELRSALVGIQLALCVTLLVGAGLLLRSLVALQRVDIGFNPEGLVSMEFRLPAVKYTTPEKLVAFTDALVERVRATPGVQSAGLMLSLPLSGNFGLANYEVDGRPTPAGQLPTSALANAISPGLFATLQVPLKAGRDFATTDRANTEQVVIVSDLLARREWPGQSAIGKRIKLLNPPTDIWATVVGVVGTIKQRTVGEQPELELYRPMTQQSQFYVCVAARAAGDPAALGLAVRDAIWSVDKDQPVWRIQPFVRFLDGQMARPQFTFTLTSIAAALALALAMVGVYGVMSYVVQQRTREVGIRVALGAVRRDIIALFIARAVPVVGVGAAVGVVGAFGVAQLLKSRQQLFGISPNDTATFVAVPLLLIVVALIASYVPARRAALVDPAVTLRSD